MTTGTKAKSEDSVRRELAALKQRVSWLEAALKPGRGKPALDRKAAGAKRNNAEAEARRKALDEYYARQHEDFLRTSPFGLEIQLKGETEVNDFLKSRGFRPNPSRIPESLWREVRALKKHR